MPRALFIGGPWDGRLVMLDDRYLSGNAFHVTEFHPMRLDVVLMSHEEAMRQTYACHHYHPERFMVSEKEEFVFMLHEKMSTAEAMALLVSTYSEATRKKRL